MSAPSFGDNLAIPTRTPVDRDSLQFYAISTLVHAVMLLVIMTFPDNAASLELDDVDLNDRFLQLALTPEQMEEEPVVARLDGPEAGGDAAHAGDEGKAGREDAPEANRKLAIEGPTENEDLEIRRERDQQIATNSGIAGELQVASPWGTSDQSVGSDALHALGQLNGSSIGESGGIGLGVSGAGRGGGSDVQGSLGLDHKVKTRGRDTGVGAKAGCVLCGGKEEKVPEGDVTWRPPVVEGGLDREIIQRVVRQQRRGIKACYEAELMKNRKLSGEVKVKFTVSSAGHVIAAVVERTSLNNAAVESCMTNRIRRWNFPEPTGGQMVIVKYPFRFSSGG
jgi:TonB family protein